MHKGFLKTAFLLGAFAVVLGAFAAHGLKNYINDKSIATFETGVRYQFYHVFALIVVAILYKEYETIKTAGWFFIIGILLFSGSLYVLSAMNGVLSPGFKWLGPITPFGGLFFIAGWLWMFIAVFRKR